MMVCVNAKVFANSIKSTERCAKYARTCSPMAGAVIDGLPTWHFFQEGVGGQLKMTRAFH